MIVTHIMESDVPGHWSGFFMEPVLQVFFFDPLLLYHKETTGLGFVSWIWAPSRRSSTLSKCWRKACLTRLSSIQRSATEASAEIFGHSLIVTIVCQRKIFKLFHSIETFVRRQMIPFRKCYRSDLEFFRTPLPGVGYCLGNAVVQISILRMIAGVSDLRLKGTLRIVLHTR